MEIQDIIFEIRLKHDLTEEEFEQESRSHNILKAKKEFVNLALKYGYSKEDILDYTELTEQQYYYLQRD